MSTKITQAPQFALPTIEAKQPQPNNLANQAGLPQGQEEALTPLAPQAQETPTQDAPLQPQVGPAAPAQTPAHTHAPTANMGPVAAADQFTDLRVAPNSQELIGTVEKSIDIAPMMPTESVFVPMTPFESIPANQLSRFDAFTELGALKDLGKIRYTIEDNGHVKLFAPAFDVGFRHTSMTDQMAKDHWFDFPEPSMAVETARLANWAFDHGIEQISHRGFQGESGAGIDFGPKYPGELPHPTPIVAQELTTPAMAQEFTTPAVAQEFTPPMVAQEATVPMVTQEATAPVLAQAATAPQAEVALPTASQTTPAPAPAVTTPTAAPTAAPTADAAAKPQTPASTEAEATETPKKSFLGNIVDKAGGAIRSILQLDIAGTKGTDPKTGFKFDRNAFRDFLQAPHDHFLRSAQSARAETVREERAQQERDYQRQIEQQMSTDRLRQLSMERMNQDQEEQLLATKLQQQDQAPAPEQTAEKLLPAATGAFHSPFSSLQNKLFERLDDVDPSKKTDKP